LNRTTSYPDPLSLCNQRCFPAAAGWVGADLLGWSTL